MVGRKLTEFFDGRDDRRVYHSLSLAQDTNVTLQENVLASEVVKTLREAIGRESIKLVTGDHLISKMAEKYSRNPNVDANRDIRKVSYLLTEGKIRVDFHRDTGQILAPSLMFKKVSNVLKVDEEYVNYRKELKLPSLTTHEIQGLLGMQKDCLTRWRLAVEHLFQITDTRRQEEQLIVSLRCRLGQKKAALIDSTGSPEIDKVLEEIVTGSSGTLVKHVYDVAREQARHEAFREGPEVESEERQTGKIDILAPYLLEFQSKPIDAAAAEMIARKCKSDFRKRLLDRATIIQKRLDEEREQLKKRKSALQRRGDNQDEDERAFEQYQSEALFRVQILEQRLARHETQAIRKFAELEKTLAEDPRLDVLWNKHDSTNIRR
eukprot:GHVS01011187.1.p1 GENE.GHVS01011187.1~~GHVS01011187.1.p1  ORF type:complete len:379 (-),score=55.98 GHVS01011187.1:101-1237(-)